MTDAEGERWLNRAMAEYRTGLMRMAYLYLGDRALAEDAVQETFIKAYYHLDSFRGDSGEKTWLMRIAINTCVSMRRGSWMRLFKRTVSIDGLKETGAEESYGDDTVIGAVNALPDRIKRVILLRYYQEMTVAEIADALGISVPAAQSRLKRGRDKLRETLREWYFDDE